MIIKLILIFIFLIQTIKNENLIGKKKDLPCPDYLNITNFLEMNDECVKKHQFVCHEFGYLKCRFLNRDFNCEKNKFCPHPFDTIQRIVKNHITKVTNLNMPNLFELQYDNLEYTVDDGEEFLKDGNLELPSNFTTLLKETSVKNLILANLNMTRLPQFQNLNSLIKILINDNDIANLVSQTFYNLSSLEIIDFSSNNLKFLSPFTFDTLLRLEEIDLSSNLLTILPNKAFNNLPFLRQLRIINNQIKSIDAYAFFYNDISYRIKLKYLDLTNNKIKYLFPTDTLEYLEFLSISGNELKKINCTKLISLEELQLIELDANEIKYFNCDLKKLTKLYSISLKHNELKSLPKSSFYEFLKKGGNLMIKENPFNCSKVKWLTDLNNNFLQNTKGNCIYGNQFFNITYQLKDLKNLTQIPYDNEDEHSKYETDDSSSFKNTNLNLLLMFIIVLINILTKFY